MIEETLKNTLDRLVPEIITIYGDHLKKVILYGSVARGDDTPESDVDIAILVDKRSEEMDNKVTEAVVPLQFDCGRLLSVIDIDYDQYVYWQNYLPFYKSIDKEGIVLWKTE